jgi:hypothetical protein
VSPSLTDADSAITADRVVLAAIELLHLHGWCKLEFEDKDGRLCLVGSLVRACGGSTEASVPFIKAMTEHLGEPVMHWNDRYDVQFEDVINELGALADKLKVDE